MSDESDELFPMGFGAHENFIGEARPSSGPPSPALNAAMTAVEVSVKIAGE